MCQSSLSAPRCWSQIGLGRQSCSSHPMLQWRLVCMAAIPDETPDRLLLSHLNVAERRCSGARYTPPAGGGCLDNACRPHAGGCMVARCLAPIVAGITGDRNRRCRHQIGLQASKFVPACRSNRNKCRMQQVANGVLPPAQHARSKAGAPLCMHVCLSPHCSSPSRSLRLPR